jgi:hypothetical protein
MCRAYSTDNVFIFADDEEGGRSGLWNYREIVYSLATRVDWVPNLRGAGMERTLLRMLAAATTAATFSVSGFTITAAAQTDEQPTHAELVQRWAEAGIDAQLKGMKTSLRLTADQEKDWAPFESAVKDAEKARVIALQKEQSSNLSPMDRNSAKADRFAQSQADLEKIIEAAKPLYQSLDGAQKHKFIALGRMLVPERGQFAKEVRRLSVGD